MHHAAVRDVVERQFGTWDEGAQDGFFVHDWDDGAFEIIEYDGQPCGYVCVEDRAEDVHLREIVVSPRFQGLGIGTLVIASAIDTARGRHVPMVLGTLHENRAARLYLRLGFIETGRTDTHTQFRLEP